MNSKGNGNYFENLWIMEIAYRQFCAAKSEPNILFRPE